MEIGTGMIIGAIVAMAGAIVALWRQNMMQQQATQALLGETKQLMGAVAELVRNANSLMVEVKNTMANCRAESRNEESARFLG